MKVRIEEKGWELFDGDLGGVEFIGGVSTRVLSPMEIARIGANIKLVIDATDVQIGPGMDANKAETMSAPVLTPVATLEDVVEVLDAKHTIESLNKLAEDGGIKAIREVAAEYEVKGVAISDLIEQILKKQAKQG